MKHYQLRFLYPLAGTIISILIFYRFWENELRNVALAVVVFGLFLWWIATIALGKSFSMTPQARDIVQTGIYAFLHHPIYVGISFVVIGWAALVQNLFFTILAVLVIWSCVVRAGLEEKKLIQAFGEKYLEYKKKTKLF